MKKLLPGSLKQWLWFVFKSPQRRMVGWHTWLTDIRGYGAILFKSKRNLQPVSICTGLKNRSQAYLDYVISSLVHAEHPELIELSVFDCGSDDVPDLEQRIRTIWKGKLVFHSEPLSFSRSVTFNKAIAQATHHYIFACDADISVPRDIVTKVNRYLTLHTAWFPVVYWLDEQGAGRFFTEGTGLFAATKTQFEIAGKYDERIIGWGKEDWLLFFNFYRSGICPVRTREAELVHHWHPTLKPMDFIPLF